MTEENPVRFTVGLSIGPPSDTTGLVVVETTDRHDLEGKPHPFLPACPGPARFHAVRHLQRFFPGTSYAEQRDTVGKILENLSDSIVVVDVTGVGKPIADLFTWPKTSTCYVTLTAGDTDNSFYRRRLARLDVAAGLQLALQEGRLAIAAGPLAGDLARDLRTFNPRPAAGAASELAWRDRPQDDLVYALAAALVEAERGPAFIKAIPRYQTPARYRGF